MTNNIKQAMKEVHQACYKRHGMEWTQEAEDNWQRAEVVHCPDGMTIPGPGEKCFFWDLFVRTSEP